MTILMKKLLILEDRTQVVDASYDHIFSFSSDQAHSFADDYVGPSEVQFLYDTVYDDVCARLGSPAMARLFSYRGVNLLWCFKKELFHFVYLVALKWEILRRVMEKFPDAHICMPEGTGDFASDRMADIVTIGIAKTPQFFQWIPVPAGAPMRNVQNKCSENRLLPWSPHLRLGKLDKCRTAIFSDYARSKSVINILSDTGCALFTNAPSFRTIFRAIRNNASLYQVAFDGKRSSFAADTMERLLQNLNQARIFSGIKWGELDGEPFLQKRFEQLCHGYLPRLLFEIDAMHLFFQEAKSLKAALLDEDIDPCKNAFCQIARQYNVKTFVELHGALGAKHGMIPLTADKMFVWGKAQKDKLARWGCPDDKIIVSGCSRYAHYQKMDEKQARQEVAKDLRLDASKKTVLLVFAPVNRWNSWYEHRVWRVISEALDAAEELSKQFQVQFIIKLHPAETNESFYRAWVKGCGLQDRVVVLRKYDPLLLAKAVDLLVVYGSTYAVDGFALNKPVICLDDGWDPLLDEFRSYSVFFYANDKQEILRTASDILANGFSRPISWDRAKAECLNQNGKDPAAFIAARLSNV